MSPSPGARIGPYEILSLLGAGGMGQVWKARDTRLDRIVAIKTSAASFSDRFMREARAVAALNHPNVCTLYDVGPDYLVMEFIEGAAPKGPLPVETVLDYARQIAAAMDAAHEKGIVHRDLKPANIRVTPQGVLKVLDFGLAKQGPVSDEGPPVSASNSPTLPMGATQVGAILGTASYMSPEQARGKAVDKRADIWAFGVVLYELATGDRLFEGETVSDTLACILVKDPDLTRLPPQLDRLVRWCLEKDSAKRLRDIADARPLLDPPAEKPIPPAVVGKPNRWWQAAAVSAVVAAAAVSVIHLREKPARAPEPFHFQLRLPEKASYTPSSTVVLSPDGRHVAFSGAGPEGPMVFVQDMDGGEPRALPGTRTGTQPPPFFWSPDGRYIVFSANSPKLSKVDINTGVVQDICDKSGPPVGGAWNADNTIIFGSTDTGLWRVPADGGKAVPLTRLDGARHERMHELPMFLPDGRHFLYLAISSDAGESGIYAASLDDAPGGPAHRVVTTEFGAGFVPDTATGRGRLLYLHDRQLVAQAFDPDRLALMGDPLPVPARVGTAFQTALFSASPDLLVYRTGGSLPNAELTWVDAKSGNAIATVGEVGVIGSARLSPDETRVAYRKSSSETQSDLWILDLARGVNTRFTFGGGGNDFPVWSPDGSEIAFSNDSSGKAAIFKKRADGTGEETVLLRTDLWVRPTSWSNDGKYLLYSSATSASFLQQRIGLLPLKNGGKLIPFSTGTAPETGGQFSPDGRLIAYSSAETGNSEVYVRAFSPDAEVHTGGKWMVSGQGGGAPRWTADGRKLFWTTTGGTVMMADVDTAGGFRAGVPVKLYQMEGGIVAAASFLTRRGQALLVLPVKQRTVDPLRVLVNWRSTLKRN